MPTAEQNSPQWWHSNVLIRWSSHDSLNLLVLVQCITNIWIYKFVTWIKSYSTDDSSRLVSGMLHSLCYRFFYYRFLIWDFWIKKIMWSIINWGIWLAMSLHVSGMLAKITRLFCTMECGSLERTLIYRNPIITCIHYSLYNWINFQVTNETIKFNISFKTKEFVNWLTDWINS